MQGKGIRDVSVEHLLSTLNVSFILTPLTGEFGRKSQTRIAQALPLPWGSRILAYFGPRVELRGNSFILVAPGLQVFSTDCNCMSQFISFWGKSPLLAHYATTFFKGSSSYKTDTSFSKYLTPLLSIVLKLCWWEEGYNFLALSNTNGFCMSVCL